MKPCAWCGELHDSESTLCERCRVRETGGIPVLASARTAGMVDVPLPAIGGA